MLFVCVVCVRMYAFDVTALWRNNLHNLTYFTSPDIHPCNPTYFTSPDIHPHNLTYFMSPNLHLHYTPWPTFVQSAVMKSALKTFTGRLSCLARSSISLYLASLCSTDVLAISARHKHTHYIFTMP